MSNLVILNKLKTIAKRLKGSVDFIASAEDDRVRAYFVNIGDTSQATIIYCPVEEQLIINSVSDYLLDFKADVI
jgi:hypothetical protein